MASTRSTLKAYFNTGDKPTEAQFSDLIDSIPNILDDGPLAFTKLTFDYTDFQPGVNFDSYIDAFDVPQGYQLDKVVIVSKTQFNGAGISAANLRGYDSSDTYLLTNWLINLYTAPSNTFGCISPGYSGSNVISSIAASSKIRMRLTSAGAFISALAGGEFDLYYRLFRIF